MGNEAQAILTANLEPRTRDTIQRVAEVITTTEPRLDAAIKWGRLTFALAGDFHHWICGLAATRRGVTLQFHFGGLLADPDGMLIAGSSRFGRKLEFTSPEMVDAEVVAGFTRAAVEQPPSSAITGRRSRREPSTRRSPGQPATEHPAPSGPLRATPGCPGVGPARAG